MTITMEEVEEATRDWLAAANARDVDKITAIEGAAVGFGIRTRAARNLGVDSSRYRAAVQQWLSGLDTYEGEFEELRTDVRDDVGFAWGVYVERFQLSGQPPELARVRFSHSMTRDADGQLRMLMFHRDIQPFDAEGRYLRSLTVGEASQP